MRYKLFKSWSLHCTIQGAYIIFNSVVLYGHIRSVALPHDAICIITLMIFKQGPLDIREDGLQTFFWEGTVPRHLMT